MYEHYQPPFQEVITCFATYQGVSLPFPELISSFPVELLSFERSKPNWILALINDQNQVELSPITKKESQLVVQFSSYQCAIITNLSLIGASRRRGYTARTGRPSRASRRIVLKTVRSGMDLETVESAMGKILA